MGSTVEAQAKIRSQFREIIDDGSSDIPEDTAVLQKQLMQKAKDEMLVAQRANIGPVWEAFDHDGDGTLSSEECSRLVAQYLKAFVPKAPEVVRSAIELGIELQIVCAKEHPRTKRRGKKRGRLLRSRWRL